MKNKWQRYDPDNIKIVRKFNRNNNFKINQKSINKILITKIISASSRSREI